MEEIHWNFDNYGTFFVVLLTFFSFEKVARLEQNENIIILFEKKLCKKSPFSHENDTKIFFFISLTPNSLEIEGNWILPLFFKFS